MAVATHKSPVFREWQTWLTLFGCYATWVVSLYLVGTAGLVALIPAVFATTLHSSLQHEALHGHPTRSPLLNELLIFPALGVWFPYRRYRQTHLRHHRDVYLTDPFDDPESWYLTETDWVEKSYVLRQLLHFNATLLGRMLIGPALAWFALWRVELGLLLSGNRTAIPGLAKAWTLHLIGLVIVYSVLWLLEVNWALYTLLVAYPGLSMLLVRSYIEHRAAVAVSERTAIVESGWLMSFLFLNNNLHACHHQDPCLAWYLLPQRWRNDKSRVLSGNAHYHFPGGYLQVAQNWLFARREPIVHPYLNSNTGRNSKDGNQP